MATKRTSTTRKNGWLIPAVIAAVLTLCLGCFFVFGLTTTGVLNPGYQLVPVNATERVAPPEEPATPATEEPAASANSNETSFIWIVGGRQDDQKKGYEYIAVADEKLIAEGTPLQPFFSQVTREGFVNSLNLGAQHEVLNDGVQFLIVGDTAYIMPRETSASVSFWSISWIQYVAGKGILICVDDAGAPGDWIGACAGETMWVTTSMPVDQLLVSNLFSPWAAEFVDARNAFNGQVFNDKIEVIKTFRAK